MSSCMKLARGLLLQVVPSFLVVFGSTAFAAGGADIPAESAPAAAPATDKTSGNSKATINVVSTDITTEIALIQALVDSKKFQESAEKAQKALTQFASSSSKDQAKILNLLGFSQRNLENYTEAVTTYKKALELDPAFAQAKEYLAVTYLHLKDTKAAKKLYTELKKSNPELAKLVNSEAKKLKVKF